MDDLSWIGQFLWLHLDEDRGFLIVIGDLLLQIFTIDCIALPPYGVLLRPRLIKPLNLLVGLCLPDFNFLVIG